MVYRANEIKVGLMIVASLVILGLFLVAIFGTRLGEKTNEYLVYLQYIGGISEGSLVKYRGMDVGQVTEITLPDAKETRIGVKLEVNIQTPIRTDSRAFVTAIGLMADQHIEIAAGSPDADLLPSGNIIDSKEVLSFAQMTEALGELNNQLQVLISRVSDIFNDDNRSHLSSMIGNMDRLIEEGREPFLKSVANLEKSSSQFAELSKDIKVLIGKKGGNIEEILSNLEATTKATRQLVSDMRTSLGNLKSIMPSDNSSIVEIMENFQIASQNLQEFTRMLKEKPWLLVRKAAPPERKIP